MTREATAVDFEPSSPPKNAAAHEAKVDPGVVTGLPSTAVARDVLSNYKGGVLASELVTFDPNFGHIYRYDVLGELDDGLGDPEAYRGRLVLTDAADSSVWVGYHSLLELQEEVLRHLQ